MASMAVNAGVCSETFKQQLILWQASSRELVPETLSRCGGEVVPVIPSVGPGSNPTPAWLCRVVLLRP
jgi:hypothetical protein